MRLSMKRMLSAMLALAMVLTMMPAIALFAGAAELSGLSDSSIGLEYTEAGNKGTVNWSAAGTTINGSLQGASGTYYKQSESTLTIQNLKNSSAKLSFDYAVTTAFGTVTIGGVGYTGSGTYSTELEAGASISIVLKVVNSSIGAENKATLAVSNISLVAERNATTTFQVGEGGSYTVTDAAGKVTAITAQTKLEQHSSKAYTLTATAAEGYVFYGWYNVTTGSYISYAATAPYQSDNDCTVKPVFISADAAVFQAGSAKFTNLTEAADYAKANGYATVVLVQSGAITGSHTISAGVTLLIPFDDAHTCYTNTPGMTGVVLNSEGKVAEAYPWVQPYAYATLTLATGAKLTVDGAISVGGEHYASSSAQGADGSHCGSPSGPVGFIKMEATSEIVINNNGALYAWGYVIGDGTVTAKNGATVCENIQFTDYRGGSATMSMAATYPYPYQVFPMNQYYVQNVEAKLVLEYGSTEYVHTALYVPSANMAATAGVKFIGEGGMFRAVEGGSIVKQYLPEKDRLQIDVIGGGSINSLALELGGQSADTSSFVLPITNNITINILSGVTTINQDIALLPGAEVTIAKEAELILSNIERTVSLNGQNFVVHGCNLFVYDADEWKTDIALDPDTGKTVSVADGKFVYINRNFAPVYSPSCAYTRTDADLKDVVLDINGTLTINGYIYTTEGGADICSTQGTGVISMASGRSEEYKACQEQQTEYYTWQAIQMDKVYFAPIVVTSLKLHNADGSYTETEDAVATDMYYWNAECGLWIKNYSGGHKGVREGYTAASCEEGGYTSYTCTICGNSYKKYDGSSAKGHTKGTEVIENKVDVTCTADGSYDTVVYCTKCNDEISRVTTTVPATGHTKGTEVIENKVDATCTTSGSYDTVIYCTVCDEEQSRVTTTVPATGHTNGSAEVENEKQPTAEEDGSYDTVIYCAVCREELSRVTTTVPATGHSAGKPVIENEIKATCTTDGSYDTVIYCIDEGCGDVISRVTTTVPATGHTHGAEAIENKVDATCTADGSYDTVIYCTVCGEELSRVTTTIPATGHTHGAEETENKVDATCTTSGSYDTVIYCTVCGEELSRVTTTVSATGHTEGEMEVIYADDGTYYEEIVRCTECGEIVSSNIVIVVVYGDVNFDGEVDILDANLIAAYYNERIDFTEAQLSAADVNGDGEVDILDANLVAAYYNERIDIFPIEK